MIPGPEASDEQLVAAFLATDRRDERPFSELFRRRRRQIWLTCRRYFEDPRDAEDFTQEVFFQAFRKLPQYRGEASFRTWLQRIAENVCKNELRRRSRRPRTVIVETEALEASADPGGEAGAPDAALSRRDLARALDRLSEDERRVLGLVASDLPYAAVAEHLGISLSATKMRVLRARLTLRSALESRTKGESKDV